MGTSRRLITDQFEDTVPAATSKVVDSVPLSEFQNIHYGISYLDGAANLSRSLKLDVFNSEGTLRDQVYGKSGNSSGVAVDAVLNGTKMDLTITNNRTDPIDLVVTKTTA